MRAAFHRYIPAQFHDPFGLLVRLIRERDPAALFAIVVALLGIVAIPLDRVLEIFEKRLYAEAKPPKQPMIFVCGAPRTGTTLVSQVLIANLPVAFFNNLTAIFPRSPITANRLFGRFLGKPQITYSSFYGKSVGFAGPNDALYIWDRWFGKDRTRIPTSLDEAAKNNMIQFFGAAEAFFQKPVLNKNNNLNTCAHLVADQFDNAWFICMNRDTKFLAQSLLKARLDIHGDAHVAYGISYTTDTETQEIDVIEDVCRQTLFHQQTILEQQAMIGPDRFWIIQYEDFCQNPAALLQRVYEEILKQPAPESVLAGIEPFRVSNRVRLEPELFQKIEETLLALEKLSAKPVNS
ncbi:MAG TPA: sulfotransferase [Spirillospora sp.]|nr:sulfotransferase [Spirillospora sp.]